MTDHQYYFSVSMGSDTIEIMQGNDVFKVKGMPIVGHDT